MKYSSIFVLILMSCLQLDGQQTNSFILNNFEGLYQDDSGVQYIVNPSDDFPHFTIMQSGETHMIRQKDGHIFEYSATRNNWDSVGGTIEFESSDGHNSICVSNKNREGRCARGIPMNSQELSLSLDKNLFISGVIFQPSIPKSNLVAVLLHGDGDNDRYDLYDIGMYLISEGYSVFAFDKRNVGKSKGPEVEGDGYDEISRFYATDAIKIISKLKKEYPTNKFGVIGISQGGYIGSIVSSEIDDLAFYVNIAGNSSVGYEQWKHYMISYLKRSGFEKKDIIEAEDYFETFFDVGLQKVDYTEYISKHSQYNEKAWFAKLKSRKLIEWKDEASAIAVVARNSFTPSSEIKKVKAPSLGIFYEFDHSTPSDSPIIFFNSLTKSHSKDISVRIFPNATHGGWKVDSYYFDSSKITNVASESYYFIIDWMKSI